MSARRVSRALARLASPRCILAKERASAGYGVFPNADRRRRPLVRLSAEEVEVLASEGAVVSNGSDAFVLSEAGWSRVRRESAEPGEAYAAQHGPIVDRPVITPHGAQHRARGYDVDRTLRRLAILRDSAGRPWLSEAELAAAARLRSDWQRGQQGLVRGSDWTAPPMGSTPRGPGHDGAVAAHCDARRRVDVALARLAAPLRIIVERVCLHDEGLEAMERAEAWPARSGKLALKLALAQLAAQ